jgi:hypothetical protein
VRWHVIPKRGLDLHVMGLVLMSLELYRSPLISNYEDVDRDQALSKAGPRARQEGRPRLAPLVRRTSCAVWYGGLGQIYRRGGVAPFTSEVIQILLVPHHHEKHSVREHLKKEFGAEYK